MDLVFLVLRNFGRRLLPVLFAAPFLAAPSVAQPFTTITDDLVTWTETTVDNLPDEGSDAFVPADPSSLDYGDFQIAVAHFLAEDLAAADLAAAAVDYEVVVFEDTGNGNGNEALWGLFPTQTNTEHRGFYFLRPRAQVARNLVLEAPHPRNDLDTALLASDAFRQSGARAFFFAGTHRCANLAEASACDGNTTTCSETSQPFRISDMAHTRQGFFHAFHELVSVEEVDTVTIQIHGFSSDSTDPEFSISDGSHDDVANNLYLPNAFTDDLFTRLQATTAPGAPAKDGNSCNRTGDIDLKCGTVNTQGRFVNGSPEPCETSAASANGHFLHVELSRELRQTGGIYEPQLVIDTINAVVPQRGGSIEGRVWADLDGGGQQDPQEGNVAAAQVELYRAGVLTATTHTDGFGLYRFDRLDADDYQVRVLLPAGYAYSPMDATSDDLDSDVDPLDSGRTATLGVVANQALTHVDAGLVPSATGSLGDRIWEDTSGEGLQSGGEPGIDGILVELVNAGDVVIDSTTTAGGGLYSFTGVVPGSYSLRLDAPGWAPTLPGVDPTTGSDLLDEFPLGTAPFPLAAGQSRTDIDGGLTSACVDVVVVAEGSNWKTLGGGTWNNHWMDSGFADGDWDTVQTPAGFPASKVNRTLTNTGATTYYFRHTFEVADPTLYGPLTLEIDRDDAAVVYLNGIEVLRSNLPAGAIAPSTPANGDSRAVDSMGLAAADLLSGTNVLAVEIHQDHDGGVPDSDVVFELLLRSQICKPCLTKLDEFELEIGAYIDEEDATKNKGGRDDLQMDFNASDFFIESSLMFFDVASKIPADAEVLHAEIVVEVENDTSDFFPFYALRRHWVEDEVTWTRAASGDNWQVLGAEGGNDRSTTALGRASISDTGPGRITFNQAGRQEIEAWLTTPADNHGVLFVPHASQTNGLDLESDDGNHPPVLRVLYRTNACGG